MLTSCFLNDQRTSDTVEEQAKASGMSQNQRSEHAERVT